MCEIDWDRLPFESFLALNLLYDLSFSHLNVSVFPFLNSSFVRGMIVQHFFFPGEVTGHCIDGLSLCLVAFTDSDTWGWGVLFMWEGTFPPETVVGGAGSY